jgi:hypothetical protein
LDIRSIVEEQVGDIKGLRSKIFEMIHRWVTRNNKAVNKRVILELDKERTRQANNMTDRVIAKMLDTDPSTSELDEPVCDC